jgi:hypothetical protein
LHTNEKASKTAHALNAKAFTIGRDIVFGQGQYAPYSFEGKKLIAHELEHVAQQRKGFLLQRQPSSKSTNENELESYFPGEMSLNYYKLTPEERAKVNEEVDRIFKVETGISRKLSWEDPKDRIWARRWLRIRDRVIAMRDKLQPHELIQTPEKKLNIPTTAEMLIKQHKTGPFLDEEALGKDLLKRLPGEGTIVNKVLDILSSVDRDDVSLEILKSATDEEIKIIAKSKEGNTILLRLVSELQKGPTFADEKEQIQRTMSLIAEAPILKEASGEGETREVEIITFRQGALDPIACIPLLRLCGHTSINVGDLNFNFAENGWECGLTKAQYMKKNEFRDGVGQVLNVTEEDAIKLQKNLSEACGTDLYIIGSGNVCTSATGQMLQKILSGLKPGWDPQSFEKQLDDSGYVKSKRNYPKK